MKQTVVAASRDASIHIATLFALFRWQFWGVSLIPVLLGYYMAQRELPWSQLLCLLVIYGPCLEGAAEAINDYFDVETDRLESVKRIGFIQLSGGTGILQTGRFKMQSVLTLALSAYVVGFVLAACFFPLAFTLTVVSGAFIGIGYSAPPFRLKARGFLGPLSVGISFGCVTLLAGFTASGAIPEWQTLLHMFPLVSIVTGLFLTHQIVDYPADLESAVRTFCVRHGGNTTRAVAAMLIVGGVSLALMSPRHPSLAIPAAAPVLGGIVWVLLALLRGRITSGVRVVAVLLEATVGVLCLV